MASFSQSLTQKSVFAQRQATLAVLLERRIAAAKARNDQSLLALLEQEQIQLDAEWSMEAQGSNPLQQLWSWWVQSLNRNTQLSIEQIVDDRGQVWWRGFDPRTGKGIFAESEAEIVRWIEQYQLGR